MNWLGNLGLQFTATVFGVIVAVIGGYAYYTTRLSRSELIFMFVGVAALLAYGIAGTATVLSLPQFASNLFAGLAGLAFIGLFLYWAYHHEAESNN